MKKQKILDMLNTFPEGSKIRIEFNIGSSGTDGAVEGYLDKSNNLYLIIFATGQNPVNLTFADKEINGYIWSYPSDIVDIDRKSTRLNSSHMSESRMPSSA